MAVVRNNRSTKNITIELAVTGAGDGTHGVDEDAGRNAQGFFKVVPDDGVNQPDNGPVICGEPAVDKNNDGDTDDEGEAAEATVDSATDDTIAQIPARHGDRLVITAPGLSGQIELTVDGLGPDFSAITPDDNAVTRSNRLAYSFEVRDDDSGLRHDGESVISRDGDREEINPDGDQILSSEPLSIDPDTAVPANGAAADIKVNVAPNPRSALQDPACPGLHGHQRVRPVADGGQPRGRRLRLQRPAARTRTMRHLPSAATSTSCAPGTARATGP